MDTKRIFSRKAEKYSRYRWDYAPEAVAFLFEKTRLTGASTVADIGAGTGILSRHFAGKVGLVYTIEPNPEMRALLERELASLPGWHSLSTCAENTGLPDHSVDLITIATAIHWFDPIPARQEFLRILKPGGWLAVLRNPGDNPRMNLAFQSLMTAENGADRLAAATPVTQAPIDFYYGKSGAACYEFPFVHTEEWDEFLGAMVSHSNAPDEDHPLFGRFAAAAREVFERFSQGGILEIEGHTELFLDQPV